MIYSETHPLPSRAPGPSMHLCARRCTSLHWEITGSPPRPPQTEPQGARRPVGRADVPAIVYWMAGGQQVQDGGQGVFVMTMDLLPRVIV